MYFFIIIQLFLIFNLTSFASNAKNYNIGFSQINLDTPWRIAETKDILKNAKENNYNIIFKNANDNIQTQKKQIYDMLATHSIDILILCPKEESGYKELLTKASLGNIPVILLDRSVNPNDLNYLTYSIHSNFFNQGKIIANQINKSLDSSKHYNIIELLGDEKSSVTKDRSDGFETNISKSNTTISRSKNSSFTRVDGKKNMEKLIISSHNNIDIIFAYSDELALGAISALKNVNIKPGKDVKIYSIDGSSSALKAIIIGDLVTTVETTPFLGADTFKLIKQIRNNTVNQREITISDRYFDKNNASKFVNKSF